MPETLTYLNQKSIVEPTEKAIAHFQNDDVKIEGMVEDSRFYSFAHDNGIARELEILLRSAGRLFIATFPLSVPWLGSTVYASGKNEACASLINDDLQACGSRVVVGGQLDLTRLFGSEGHLRMGINMGYVQIGGREYLLDRKAQMSTLPSKV